MVEKLPNPSNINQDVAKQIGFEFSAEGGLFEELITPFKRDRNVDDLVNSLRREYKKLEVVDGTMELWFSLKFSDVLARSWEKGPQFFVSYMKDKGIEPDDGVYGPRLEAHTCLYKALVMEDEGFQKVFGQPKLL